MAYELRRGGCRSVQEFMAGGRQQAALPMMTSRLQRSRRAWPSAISHRLLARRTDERAHLGIGGTGNADSPSLNPQATFGVELDRAGINPVLLLKNPRRQRLCGIPFQNRHSRLDDDGPLVHPLGYKMDRAASDLRTPIHRFLLHLEAWERRQH